MEKEEERIELALALLSLLDAPAGSNEDVNFSPDMNSVRFCWRVLSGEMQLGADGSPDFVDVFVPVNEDGNDVVDIQLWDDNRDTPLFAAEMSLKTWERVGKALFEFWEWCTEGMLEAFSGDEEHRILRFRKKRSDVTELIEEAIEAGLAPPDVQLSLSEAGKAVLEAPGDWIAWWEDEPETCTVLDAINHALENTDVTDLNRAALLAFIEQARYASEGGAELRAMKPWDDYPELLAEAIEKHGLTVPRDSEIPTNVATVILHSNTPWRAIWQDTAPPCSFFDVLEHVVSRTASQQKSQPWRVPYRVASPACAALVAYVEFWRWEKERKKQCES